MSPAAELAQEREHYARCVASLAFPDPSGLIPAVAAEPAERVSPRQLAAAWADAVARADHDASAWNLYIHVPYCKSICSFCNYKRLRVSNRQNLDQYVDFMVNEMRLLAPALAGARFGALYVGGGTPSVLDADQLDRLLGTLHDCFEFRDNPQKNFEYDPMVMTDDRHAVVKRYGFNRYSFGIQSLDAKINELHNRGPQGIKQVEKQFIQLHDDAPYAVNVDFLLGLDGTTPAGMTEEIEKVLRDHQPDEMSVYFISPTPEYLAQHFAGDAERYQAFLRDFEIKVPAELGRTAQRHGYLVTASGKHLLKLHRRQPRRRKGGQTYRYGDIQTQSRQPLYLLGLGDSARSRIFGSMTYRAEHHADERDFDGARYVARRHGLEDEVFGYAALMLRDGNRIDRATFRGVFGKDLLEVAGDSVDKLVELGVAQLSREALELVPQSREERLRDVMFFLPQARRAALGEAPSRAGPGGGGAVVDASTVVRSLAPGDALPDGWNVADIGASGVTIRDDAGAAEILIKLLAPAGAHPAFQTTARYDVQYHVRAGSPTGPELDAPVAAVVDAVRADEK